MRKVCFIHQKSLGHAVEANLLRAHVDKTNDIESDFYDVAFENEKINNSWGWRVPFLTDSDLDLFAYRSHVAGSIEVAEYLKTRRPPDAIYVQTHNVAYRILDLMRRVPTTVTLDAPNVVLANWGWNAKLPYTRVSWIPSIRMEKRIFQTARAIIIRSEWAKKEITERHGIDANKIHVVPSPIHIPEINRQYTGDEKVRLLFVGADFERKGGDKLLAAFKRRFADSCELHLVTKADIMPSPGVHVHRGISDQELDNLYRKADIFVFPTHHEPYGRVVAEAMAYGLPVIASNVAAIPEILSNGECGRFIEPGDAPSLEGAIEELVSDPELRNRLGSCAREKAKSEFDTNLVCQRVINIIKSTMA